MRFSFLTCFLLFVFTSQASEVKKSQKPDWIQSISEIDEEVIEGNGGFQYLLIDLQDNIVTEESYKHYAIKILNPDGVQSMSDISVTFDPAFQTLYFHEIKIKRNGEYIQKLDEKEIKTIQRETSMERALYDGSLTAVVNLTDVRVDDIIEYSYTIKGYNPIYQGKYHQTFYHQFTIPVNRVFNRIITDKIKIKFKTFEGASNPKIGSFKNFNEYKWDLNATNYKLYDNNVPAWYDPHKRVSLSTYEDWSEVVKFCLPLYQYDRKDLEPIRSSILAGKEYAQEIGIPDMIRLVQDDIRYLGFESGIGGYKPNPPLQVFNQKYGDCKDKSLLLVALLRTKGLEAYPLLVNTGMKDEMENVLPGIGVFDHCVVNFKYNEKDYFVDPTISGQGGDINTIHFPAYKKGLLLKEGSSKLIDLPEPKPTAVNIQELITSVSINGGADLTVRTEYSGSKADYIRSYFSSSSLESIQKEYLNFYSSIYPEIESTDELKFYDYDRGSKNVVIVEEYYHINNAWQKASDGDYKYFEIYPLVLDAQINYTKSASRDMPYYMGEPYSVNQTTEFDLPDDWYIEDSENAIEGEGFSYENTIRGHGRSVSVTHNYTLEKEYIPGKEVGSMMKKHNDIRNQLSYMLTHSGGITASGGFELSWISLLLAAISLSAGIYFAIKVYSNFDPNPWVYAENKPIGSWLILPAIGLTLNPFVLSYQFFSEDYFDQNSWNSVFASTMENKEVLALIVGGEIVYNCLFLIFSVLMVVLFYQRRTNVPRLMTIYYIVSFAGPLIDTALIEIFVPGIGTDPAITRDLVKSFIAAAIWIPYFNIAERAKSTFCKTVREKEEDSADQNFTPTVT